VKILKLMGSIFGLYILMRVLIACFLPQGGIALVTLANVVLIIVFILGVFSFLLGGQNASPVKKLWRILSLIISFSVVTVILITLLGANVDMGNEFIENVVPFGKIIDIFVKLITNLDSTKDVVFLWSVWGTTTYLVENIFKLMLATILYPIVTEFFLIPFIKENDKGNNLFGLGLRKLIVCFFGAVITSYAIMFLISSLGVWLEASFNQIGMIINFVYQLIGLGGLIAVFLFTPIIRTKTEIIGSLLKMLSINFACVFVIIMCQYKSKIIDIFFVIFACIGINVICDVLFQKKEVGKRV